MKKFSAILSFFAVLSLATCTQPPNFPDEPVLTYLSVNQTEIAQGTANAERDTLIFRFGFTDGDGNLGFENDSIDIFMIDQRDGFENVFRMPFIPDEGVGNGIEGVLTIRLTTFAGGICCLPQEPGLVACGVYPEYPTQALSYKVYIRDRDNNFSNEVFTEEITILCI